MRDIDKISIEYWNNIIDWSKGAKVGNAPLARKIDYALITKGIVVIHGKYGSAHLSKNNKRFIVALQLSKENFARKRLVIKTFKDAFKKVLEIGWRFAICGENP